ncbi:MAG TPA: hypothetical protein VLF67_00210 [Candidatus Saccharimonas sp.]|nr:hypothetical protein [Candidatus Saccharimonas sp.]
MLDISEVILTPENLAELPRLLGPLAEPGAVVDVRMLLSQRKGILDFALVVETLRPDPPSHYQLVSRPNSVGGRQVISFGTGDILQIHPDGRIELAQPDGTRVDIKPRRTEQP